MGFKYTVVRLQLAKALFWMVFTDLGNVIEVNLGQLWKADSPMVATELPKVTEVKPLHSAKTKLLMVFLILYLHQMKM